VFGEAKPIPFHTQQPCDKEMVMSRALFFVLTLILLAGGVGLTQATPTATATPEPTTTPTVAPTATPFPLGDELTIATLRTRQIEGSDVVIEQTLQDGYNYHQYIASYFSDGYKIYGLLTVPFGDVPEGGFKAIVFNHGFIPPATYRTTERYVAYVNALALAGFVVFKIDMRGHGNSEGEARGTYFSPDYTIDAIAALKSLQRLDYVDPNGIGMWGHSMSGNLVLRAALIEPDVKAAVIWAGAVYSYDDFVRYSISDPSFTPQVVEQSPSLRIGRQLRELYGRPDSTQPFWAAVSLTNHIDMLQAPLQLHHAVNDDIVNIGYSYELANVLDANAKFYELYPYEGGGHDIESPYFELAMERTVAFFREHL
jgi:uncharacterized protein